MFSRSTGSWLFHQLLASQALATFVRQNHRKLFSFFFVRLFQVKLEFGLDFEVLATLQF